MKVGQLQLLLSEFSRFVGRLGDAEGENDLQQFQKLLEGNENATVRAALGKITKRLSAQSESASDVARRLQLRYSELEVILLAGQAKAAALDVEQLKSILDACAEDDIEQFVARVSVQAIQNRGKTSGKSTESREKVVHEYVNLLQRTRHDNASFDQALLALKSNKQVRTEEMRQIASAFLGYALASKKARGAALKAIGDHQALDARQEARSRAL